MTAQDQPGAVADGEAADGPAPLHTPTPTLHTQPQRTVPSTSAVLPAVQSLLQMLVVAVFVTAFLVQPIRIPSASMEPTLLVGDFLLLDKQSAFSSRLGVLPPGAVRRGDIVVFHDPGDEPAIHLIKRVVALPGDRLHLHNGVLYLNGTPQQEPYAVHRTAYPDPFRDDFPTLGSLDLGVSPRWWIALRSLVRQGEIVVPPGQYFVLGDNRNNSEDSRYWGFVPEAAIEGKPLLIYFSWNEPESSAHPSGQAIPGPGALRPRLASLARWQRTFQVVH